MRAISIRSRGHALAAAFWEFDGKLLEVVLRHGLDSAEHPAFVKQLTRQSHT